jgi:hypothetical protein
MMRWAPVGTTSGLRTARVGRGESGASVAPDSIDMHSHYHNLGRWSMVLPTCLPDREIIGVHRGVLLANTGVRRPSEEFACQVDCGSAPLRVVSHVDLGPH